MNKDNVTDSMMMDVIKRHKFFNFSSSNVTIKVQKKGQSKEIKIQRDIVGKIIRLSFDTNSCINVENLITYPLAPVILALSYLDGTIRKTCKSNLYEVAMHDLSIAVLHELPEKNIMNTYFLDLAACVRIILKDCVTVRDLAWRIYRSINNQFETIYRL